MKIKSADTVFRELGEMFDFLRAPQRTRNQGVTDEAYAERQKRLVHYALEYPGNGEHSSHTNSQTVKTLNAPN